MWTAVSFVFYPTLLSAYRVDLRVEWLKCRARSQRWIEELHLLDEEMRRCIVYCHWKAAWWSQKFERLSAVEPTLGEGLVTYASQQMSFEQQRAHFWEEKWSSIRSRAQLIRQTHLGEEESSLSVPELEVELDGEEELNEWDVEDDDEGED